MWDAEGRFHGNGKSDDKKPLLSGRGGNADFRGVVEGGRKCNDVLFAVLFVATLATMVAVGVLAGIKGDPSKLIPSNDFHFEKEKDKAEYWLQDSVAHLKRSYDIVLYAGVAMAFFIGLVWLQMMRSFTKFFIYATLVLGILLVLAVGGLSLAMGISKSNSALKIFSFCAFGLAVVLAFVTFFLRKKINLTAALFTECCKGVQHNLFGLFSATTVVFAVMTCFIGAWIFTFINLFSIPDGKFEVDVPKTMPHFNTKIRNVMYFQLFGFYWVIAFLSAIFQMAVAGAVATWYFSRENVGTMRGSPTFRSLGHALTTSFGSVALGSLVLATVQFLNFLVTKMQKMPTNNRVTAAILCCAKCFLTCVQRLVKFVNRYAYISMAMHGEGFCTSARNCFELITRNMFTAVIVDVLGDLVLFVGKVFCTAACTLFALVLFHVMEREISGVCIAAVVVISFVIFSLFAGVVGTGVDTVLVCYLEDRDRKMDILRSSNVELHTLLEDKARSAVNS